MAAGTLLDSLKFAHFTHDQDEAGGAATEGRNGVPRYNGDASRLNEWTFRVRMLAQKEKTMSDSEAKKLGSLPLRLVEGLSGQALKIAQQLDVSKLDTEGGTDYLIEKISSELRPRRMQQAWYRAMTDLSSDLKLPDIVLSEQLLLNSGLNDDQKLMIRTVCGDKMSFDKIAEELGNQHPRIHEKNNYQPPYFRRSDFRGFARTSPSTKGHGKGYKQKPRYYNAFHADGQDEENYYPETNDDQHYLDASDFLNDETDGNNENSVYFSDAEIGTYAEEHLAYLADGGLDMEDPEACEFASDLIQSEQDAYFARKGAQQKGHGGFAKNNAPPFEISGSISLDDKRARLRALKGKSKKGGGKASTSISTSSTTGTSQYSGGKGRHGKPSRPRTVYFSISETTASHPTANLAYRREHAAALQNTPPQAHQDWSIAPSMRAVPPPAALVDGHVITTNNHEDLNDNWSVVIPSSTEGSPEHGQWLPMETDDPEMQEILDALAMDSRAPEHARENESVLATTGIPPLPLREVQRLWFCDIPHSPGPDTAGNHYDLSHDCNVPSPLDNMERIQRVHAHPDLQGSHTVNTRYFDDSLPITLDRIPTILHTFQEIVTRRVQELTEGTEVPSQRLHEALDLSIATGTAWTTSPTTPPRTTTSTTRSYGSERHYGESEHHRNLKARGQKVVEMGRYKHGKYEDAYVDTAYRTWVLENIGTTSASGMKALKNYFEERMSYERQPDSVALMAYHENSDHIEEHDLIAILDTGCNQTCHGDRWLERYIKATKQTMPEADTTSEVRIRGIGGHIRTAGSRKLPLILELVNGGLAQGDLTSTELVDSDAPLLISVQAQRSLGLIIDIAGEVVHSQALGHDLKLAYKDGLLGIRLLPSEEACEQEGPEDFPNDHKKDSSEDEEMIPAQDDKAREPDTDVAYYTFDAEKAKVMNKTQHARVREGVEGVKSKDRHLWNQVKPNKARRNYELPRGCKTFILEVFAGAAMLTQMALHEWSMPVTPPVDLNTGFDLLTKQGRDEVDCIIERDDPFAITFAPVCTPWTSWTNIATGETKCKIMAERKRWQPTLAWMYDVARSRLAKGRHVIIENPWNSAMWDCSHSRRFFRGFPRDQATLEPMECVKLDQCMLGLKDEINHLPHLKPTGILTASSEVKKRLSPAKCDGMHLHQQLDTKKRCVAAQAWPRDLCSTLIQGLMAELDYLLTMVAFPAEATTELEISSDDEGEERTYLDGILTADDEATAAEPDYAEKKKQEEWEIVYEEGETPAPPQPIGDLPQRRQQQWRQLPYNTRVALRRLHHMTGHAPPSAMQRLLRTAGADQQAIRGLENFRCATCEAKKLPDKASPVKMPEEYKFNKAVSLDVFIVKDSLNKKYKVMSLVDLGTLFHAAVIVGEGGGPPSSSDMARAMQMVWLSWAGPPESIVLDRGLENRGQLQKLMTAHGVLLRYIGVESPYQLGRGERHGGILKEVIKALVTSRQLRGRQNMEFAVTESVGIKNHRVNHNGFSPSQWVLGRNPPDLESLTTLVPEAKLGIHQEILDGETSFAQQMMIRGAAKEAFSQVDSSQRIRAAMLRKSTPGRGPFHMGDLVCFHRRQGGKAGWKWFGPARVIGQEGRGTLWICHGGIPMTVSSEQCRHATGNEMMSKRMLELRPSRKRRREDMAADEDVGKYENDDPFLDDLIGVGSVAENQQQGFFDLHDHPSDYSPSMPPEAGTDEQEIHGLHPPPPGLLPGPPNAIVNETTQPDDLSASNQIDAYGQEIPGLQAPPPGLLPGHSHSNLPPDGGHSPAMPDVPDSSVGSPTMSIGEPEQEIVPQSREQSGQPDLLRPAVQAITQRPAQDPPDQRTLQQALRISPDALDGLSRNRYRSRSPPRAMMTVAEQPEAGKCIHGFLARRVNKKSAAARAKELDFKRSTGAELEGIQEARTKEWNNWQGFDAVDIISPEQVPDVMKEFPDAEITPTRWVDVNKAQPWEPPKYKSRIVVRGDLESGASTRTDSPTCSSTMLGLLLSFTANRGARLRGGDITASFLQGEKLVRVLLLRPPPGGLPGVPEGSLLRALKPVYGTRDAPRGFFKRLHNVAIKLGLRALPHEHAAYVLQDADGVQGMMVAHVDDLLWSGTEKMDAIMEAITKEFKFGSLEFGSKFDYCGRTISQESGGIRITVDVAYEVNYLQAMMQKAVVGDFIACNNLLSYIKRTPERGLFYEYNAFKESEQVIYSITDASHAADFDVSANGTPLGSRSQSGRILALGSRSLLDTGKGTLHIIEYHSNVLRRVCRSTLQAETLSLISGYEEAEHLRALLWGVTHDYHSPNLIEAMDNTLLVMMTDCKSLEQHRRQPGLSTVADKRLAIDLSAMRQLIWRRKGELTGDPLLTDEPPDDATTLVKWIDTATMLADGLTKKMRNLQIDKAMLKGTVEASYTKLGNSKAEAKENTG
ncbi:RE2, partial [Symbiodinium sp. CCMP2456]